MNDTGEHRKNKLEKDAEVENGIKRQASVKSMAFYKLTCTPQQHSPHLEQSYMAP